MSSIPQIEKLWAHYIANAMCIGVTNNSEFSFSYACRYVDRIKSEFAQLLELCSNTMDYESVNRMLDQLLSITIDIMFHEPISSPISVNKLFSNIELLRDDIFVKHRLLSLSLKPKTSPQKSRSKLLKDVLRNLRNADAEYSQEVTPFCQLATELREKLKTVRDLENVALIDGACHDHLRIHFVNPVRIPMENGFKVVMGCLIACVPLSFTSTPFKITLIGLDDEWSEDKLSVVDVYELGYYPNYHWYSFASTDSVVTEILRVANYVAPSML